MGATAFPFGDPKVIEEQLQEHWDNGARTVDQALKRVSNEMEKIMG
jgi:hypothetical protein